MRKRWIIGIAVLVVAALGVGGWLYLRAHPLLWQQALVETGLAQEDGKGVTASGFIEAEEIELSSELGGRIIEITAAEGDDVPAGHTLIRLDGSLVDAHIHAAQAAVAVAEAELTNARAGARPEQIRQAEAALDQAEAAQRGADQALQDTIAIRDNPQELDVQIAQARARVAIAEAAVAQAEAQKDAAEIGYEAFYDAREAIDEAQEIWSQLPEDRRPPRPSLQTQIGFHLIPNQYWQAWVALNTAKAERQAARTALNDLYRVRQDPQELGAAVDQAEAGYEAAQAAVVGAEAALDLTQAGPTDQQLAALEAGVRQAEAALATLERRRDRLTLDAPVGGLVLEKSLEAGELAAPGSPIVILGSLDEVKLTVYVPVNELGEIQLGQTAEIRADTFPGRTFSGEVVAIASEAEFTPRNVQTEEERVNMVFAVDITIPNPDHKLKPGVPADATILTEED